MVGAHNTRRAQAREAIRVNVLTTSQAELRMEADARNVPFATLCAKLLDVIAADSTLIDAVLDGEMKRVKGRV